MKKDLLSTSSSKEIPLWKKAIAAGSLGLVALAGCGEKDSGKVDTAAVATEAPVNSPDAKPTTEPIVETTETPETPAQTAEVRESNIYDSTTLSPQEIATSEKLEQMSLEEFEAQSLKDRLIYILYKNHEVQEDILFSDHTDQVFTDDNTTLAQHSPVFLALNAQTAGSDILKANIYASQLSAAWKVDEDNYGSGALDNLTSSKLLSGEVLELDSPEYKIYVEEATTDTKSGRYTDEDVNNHKLIAETEATPTVNPIDGSETVEKTLTILRSGVELKNTYVFIPLVEQLAGESGVDGNGLWLLKTTSEYDKYR